MAGLGGVALRLNQEVELLLQSLVLVDLSLDISAEGCGLQLWI
jgi:hypothetical protein